MKNYKVTKRNGDIETLDILKIKKVVQTATLGLEVNPLELESQVQLGFRGEMTSREIHRNLIATALKLTNIQSDANMQWRFVASRLLLMDLFKDAAINRGLKKPGYGNYYKFVKQATDDGLYDKRILESYTKDEIEEISKEIDVRYDYGFDYAGMNLLATRYLIQKKGKPFELPQELYLSIALLLAMNSKDKMKKAKEFYHLTASRKLSLATPIVLNLRRPSGSLSSCFISALSDDLNGIYYGLEQMAQISKNGGGCGVNLSRIRSTGAYIRNIKGASGGVIPWIKLINDTAIAVNQTGSRSGAITVALDVWHRDIREFLDMQTENGDQRRKCFDIFSQIVVPDLFMKRVEFDEQWTLFDPKEVKDKFGHDLAELYGDEFEKVYCELEKKKELELVDKIQARELFKTVCGSVIETGMPYVFFKDNVNRVNPNKNSGMIGNANLCVAPETLILTDRGHLPIISLENKKVNVWNGLEWSEVTVKKTAENVELLKVVLSNGVEIECTPQHHFYLKNSYRGKVEKVSAIDLKYGDKLIKYELPVIKGEYEMKYAYTHGFFCADGSYNGKSDRLPTIQLYDVKKKLVPFLELRSGSGIEQESGRLSYQLPLDLDKKYFVPDSNYTIESRVKWLAGLLDGDGTIVEVDGNLSTQLASIHLDFLRKVKLMLQTLAVDSKITSSMEAGERSMPDGRGGTKLYHCKKSYRILINSNGLKQLIKLGLKTNRLQIEDRHVQRDASRFIIVENIQKTGRISDTYCFTEPKRHMGMFNGVLTGQCVESYSNFSPSKVDNREIVVYESDNRPHESIHYSQYSEGGFTHCCNLLSLNLAEIKDEELENCVKNAVEILDNTVDITYPPTPESKMHNDWYRILGIGATGLNDWIVSKGKSYINSKQLVADLFEKIGYYGIQRSSELAKTRGKYHFYEGSEWSKGILFGKDKKYFEENETSLGKDKWLELISQVKKNGMRNGGLFAIAPNTSTSLLMGCTSSILPTYGKFYYDKASKGTVPIIPPKLNGKTFFHYIDNKLIDQNVIIDMVAEIQKWTDQGISMELVFNINSGLKAKDIKNLYFNAWKKNLKTVYYIRSIALNLEKEKEECVSCAN